MLNFQLNTCEEELKKSKSELESVKQLSNEQAIQVLRGNEQNERLTDELRSQQEKEKEKIEILNIDLEAAKSVSETQKTELEFLKIELEKATG